MHRILLLVVLVACCAGCCPTASVIEREPYGADLCQDDIESLWEDDTADADPWDCSGEEHFAETCEGLGFTVHCGVFLIRPAKFCDQ